MLHGLGVPIILDSLLCIAGVAKSVTKVTKLPASLPSVKSGLAVHVLCKRQEVYLQGLGMGQAQEAHLVSHGLCQRIACLARASSGKSNSGTCNLILP